jgi:hypothetical protein
MALLKKTQQVFMDGMENQPESTIESGKRKVFKQGGQNEVSDLG